MWYTYIGILDNDEKEWIVAIITTISINFKSNSHRKSKSEDYLYI